ncbi:MAG: hypothetical protein Q9192_006383 [Flavoplaca navasiana]
MDYVDGRDSGYGEDDSTPSSLHPDRFDHEHVSKLKEFSQDLQKAIANSFPRPSTSYTAVHVLLLRWADDDLNVQVELSSLKAVLENQYLFAAEQWDIPSLNSTRALQTKLYDFQNSHQSEDELLIVYYGGHADADRRRGRSIWAAYRQPPSDCCYAANAARDMSEGTTKEIIAACGRENPTLGVGERSFTSALIEELQAFGSQPFTVTMLHSRLITMRWRLSYTPVYALLSEHGGHSIELAPQPAPAQASKASIWDNPELDEDMMDISAPEARIASDTRVLMSVSISDDAACDIAEWKEWLTHKAPRIITQIEVRVEGVFKSHSTMLMTSLPTVAWDCLPDKAAYRFIGFINSGNLDRTHPCGDEECQCLAATVSEQQRHLLEVEKQIQFLESEGMSTLEKMVKNREATDVDEHYKLRLQANQQLKALELLKTPRSIGGVEVGDSSTQGQAEDPVPETRKKRLSAIQSELTNEASDTRTPDRSSGSLEQSTLDVIETKKQPANYAISRVFKDDPRIYTQYPDPTHVSDARVKSLVNDILKNSKPEVMTGHENAMSPTADDSSEGLPGSREPDNLQSFDTLAVPCHGKAGQPPTIIEGTPGFGFLRPEMGAATLIDGTERATLPSNRKRSYGETNLEGTTTDAIPTGSVRQTALTNLQEQKSARSPSSSRSDTFVNHARMVWPNDPSLNFEIDDEFKAIWHNIKLPEPANTADELEKEGLTPANKHRITKKNRTTKKTLQRPDLVREDWDESKLRELATVYMRYRVNTWSFLAGQLGKDWDIIEGKVSPSSLDSKQSLPAKTLQCFEKGIEELLRLAQNADSKLRASVIEEEEASSLEGELAEPTSFRSYMDSAIGMDSKLF